MSLVQQGSVMAVNACVAAISDHLASERAVGSRSRRGTGAAGHREGGVSRDLARRATCVPREIEGTAVGLEVISVSVL